LIPYFCSGSLLHSPYTFWRSFSPETPVMAAHTTRLSSLWGRLHTSFWFLPAAMSGVAVALSFVMVEVDVWLSVDVVQKFCLLYTFGPEGARAILSVIASSMITVASLIFSITMLTLQLASSQFGPRVLRNFMRDRSNQIVLGTFIATFLYCLLVLRTVRGTENSSFVPHLSVAFGALLAIASVAVHFIHHIATSIRAVARCQSGLFRRGATTPRPHLAALHDQRLSPYL
jgi:uncharacterized membrane protein